MKYWIIRNVVGIGTVLIIVMWACIIFGWMNLVAGWFSFLVGWIPTIVSMLGLGLLFWYDKKYCPF